METNESKPETNSSEEFFIFENNEKAFVVCRDAVKNLREQQKPIFVYGKAGVGKTALLKAVKNCLVENCKNQLKIERLSSREFLEEFVSSIKNHCVENFKKKYRNLDVLFMDDVQYLSNKSAIQEEFLYMFDVLCEKNSVMIFTCDRPAKKLSNFNERLKTRFCGGLSINMPAPNYKTRIEFAKKMLEIKNWNLPEKIIRKVARKKNNFCELTGALLTAIGYDKFFKTKNVI